MLELIEKQFKTNRIGKFLLSKFNLLDDDNKSFEASDSLYLPFYYYFGTISDTSNLLEIGFGLGLCSGSFLLGCKTVKNFVAMQDIGQNYNKNIAVHNIKKYYKRKFSFVTNLNDIVIKPDLVIIREKNEERMSQYLSFVWDFVNYDCKILVDYIDVNPDTFDIFCKIRNRVPEKMKTRHGCGLVIK